MRIRQPPLALPGAFSFDAKQSLHRILNHNARLEIARPLALLPFRFLGWQSGVNVKAAVKKNAAPGKLRFAKVFLEKGDKKKAVERLEEIIVNHPNTPEAAELLEGIGEK